MPRCSLLIATAAALMTAALSARSAAADSPRVEKTTYDGHAAYRLTNGKTEAVIVPELSGRVMRYAQLDGKNRLWNNPPIRTFGPGEWVNWGGDKLWPALQAVWSLHTKGGQAWPPDPTWDQSPHTAQVLPGNRLRTIGPLMAGYGTRAAREYSFQANGDFLIRTTLVKETDDPVQIGIWHVTQVPPPDAVFVPLNPDSAYKNNFHWFGGKAPENSKTTTPTPTLLQFVPTEGSYKIGVDAPVIALVAVQDGVAFVQKSDKQKDTDYPEGAPGNGFPITLYNQGEPDKLLSYVELETMSPLAFLKRGQTLVYTIRWSLHDLPEKDAASSAVRDAVTKLLTSAP